MSFRPLPAFGKPLIARRKLGERIGLLVVAVHDWDAGRELAARSGTARIIVDIDQMPHELDWSCAVALDCLIVGDCDDSVFYATATMLFAAGAASIWGQYAIGIYRLERWHTPLLPTGFYAAGDPVPVAGFGRALARFRAVALLLRLGAYGSKIFDSARAIEMQVVAEIEDSLREADRSPEIVA